MQTRFLKILGLGSLGLLLAALPALSSTVVYTDAGTWTSATTADTTVTFNGIAPAGADVTYSTVNGLVLSGVSFVDYASFGPPTYQLQVADSNFSSPWYNFGPGGMLTAAGNWSAGAYLKVTLPTNVTAISSDLATLSPNNVPITVTLSDGETFTVNDTVARPATTFFGLTTDAPISYLEFALPASPTYSSSFVALKDFNFGTANTAGTGGSGGGDDPGDVPEACTMILIGTGLVSFRYLQRMGLGLRTGQL